MGKFKKRLYIIVVGIWPAVYIMGMGFLKAAVYMGARTTQPSGGDIGYVVLGAYLLAGTLFAYIAFVKKDYYKDKAVLTAHIVSFVLMLLAVVWTVLEMVGVVERIPPLNYEELARKWSFYDIVISDLFIDTGRIIFPFAFTTVTTLRAIRLYRKKETIQ